MAHILSQYMSSISKSIELIPSIETTLYREGDGDKR